MPLAARFHLLNPAVDDFLFARIGEEENGMPVSVISALARLGADPWKEAGRLAELPTSAATEALASMIARLPLARWKPSEAADIAARLIRLLPRNGRDASAAGAKLPLSGRRPRSRLLWVLCLVLAAAAIFGVIADRRPAADARGSSATAVSSVVP